ncbi:PA14 domain-containing protein [Hymenobacter latericus]|uniref:PA14 domain-containing protein n=1 Tax=Hymenobacter sp. YIM 151858-1 TaxID=2987688 RepID=UPI0022264AB9|nr:PA14 domain-containing protein [Hymenobacter sp. YIM 151858-1]UYZ58193.1 PA14 domain-containing protein [Hymenobacter sp. YIM 151858-1]
MRNYLWFIKSAGLLLSSPTQAQTPAPAVGSGLRAEYYLGERFEQRAYTRTDPQINFDWRFESPAPGVPAENFSVRWTGYLLAPVSGVYTFHIAVDDGMRVWLGNRKILDEWRYQSEIQATRQVRLTAGEYYPLRVEYFQGSAPTRAFLGWVLPNQEAEKGLDNLFGLLPAVQEPAAVPARYLFSRNPKAAVAAPAKPASTPPRAVVAGLPAGVTVRQVPSAVVVGRRPQPAPARVAAAAQPRRAVAEPPKAAAPTPAVADLSELHKLPAGAAVELRHMYFEQSKARLLPASLPEMERLAQILKDNPALRLEIAGHTDNVGDANLNQVLSQQRAEVVRDYLVRQQIAAERLLAVGYGGTRPVADNADPQQRPRNRRVEVVVR